jgi:hypothetical protein
MKILVWNIKFFSKNRIVGQTETQYQANENQIRTANDAYRAQATLLYILSTIKQADADVFVIVEPRASAGNPGTLADPDSGGAAGLILLLAHMRSSLGNTWWLVPPQRINTTRLDPIDRTSQYTECIGVFWRSDRVTFTGPWINTAKFPWSNGTAVEYSGEWKNVVPNGTTAAGRCLYFTNENKLQGFPEVTSRLPFCTTFTEIGGTQRLLELYSVHCDTYQGALAADALLKLPFSEADKKVTLIAGDFNINVSASSTLDATSLSALEELFTLLYPGPSVNVIGKGEQYRPTTVKSGPKATPGLYAKKATLDYGLVHFSTNAFVTVPTCQVVDRVAVTPNPPFKQLMSYPLGAFTRQNDPLPVETFRGRWNYAKVGTPAMLAASPAVLADGTSDHLPILLTV